jgi:protein TonB
MGIFLPALPYGGERPGRSGVSVAGAMAGHVLVLGLVASLVPSERIADVVSPMAVRLIELLPEAPKSAPPEPPIAAPRPPKLVLQEVPAPMLAVSRPEAPPAPTAFTVPPEIAAAPAIQVASPAPRAAEPALTAARFDANYLQNPKPAYPSASRRRGEEGKVTLRVYVGVDGRPETIETRTPSGFARLDDAARDAVSRWRFVPARRGDQPMAAWVLVPIVFSLES